MRRENEERERERLERERNQKSPSASEAPPSPMKVALPVVKIQPPTPLINPDNFRSLNPSPLTNKTSMSIKDRYFDEVRIKRELKEHFDNFIESECRRLAGKIKVPVCQHNQTCPQYASPYTLDDKSEDIAGNQGTQISEQYLDTPLSPRDIVYPVPHNVNLERRVVDTRKMS